MAYLLWFRMCLEKGSEASQGWGGMSCLASRGHKALWALERGEAPCVSRVWHARQCPATIRDWRASGDPSSDSLSPHLREPPTASAVTQLWSSLFLVLVSHKSALLNFFLKKKKNKPHFKITYAFQPQSAKWIMVLLFSSMSLAIFKPEYLKCSINRRKQAIYLRPLINTNQITTIHLF